MLFMINWWHSRREIYNVKMNYTDLSVFILTFHYLSMFRAYLLGSGMSIMTANFQIFGNCANLREINDKLFLITDLWKAVPLWFEVLLCPQSEYLELWSPPPAMNK